MATPAQEEVKTKARELYLKLRRTDERPVVLEVYDEVKPHVGVLAADAKALFDDISADDVKPTNQLTTDYVRDKLLGVLEMTMNPEGHDKVLPSRVVPQGGRKRSAVSNKFGRCVKSVRKTVKARKGSNKESAAIAICVKSVLHPRGRTIKRYRKGRLTTQRRK
jgi:hypothetical protein